MNIRGLYKIFHRERPRLFFDYASATPVSESVRKAMKKVDALFHNPASIYKEGVRAKKHIASCMAYCADVLGSRPHEIIYTSGGTEAINLAIQGIVRACDRSAFPHPHIVVSAFEHSAVLETVRALESEGVLVSYVYPDEAGIVHPHALAAELTPSTVLVSVMHVNNEIGTIQPLKEISKKIKEYRTKMGRNQHCDYPYFMTDASQAALYEPLSQTVHGVDITVLDGLKMYGPRHIGILSAKKAVRYVPLMYGGGHQEGKRPGTQDVAHIMGMTQALMDAEAMKERESVRLKELQAFLRTNLELFYKDRLTHNGSISKRSPHICNVCIAGIDSEFTVLQLDARGIALSSASTCSSVGDQTGSYVLDSLGKKSCSTSSLRISFGRETTKKDMVRLLEVLRKTV